MSMATLSIIQIVLLFIIYTFFAVLLPGIAFGTHFQGKRATVRFVSYFCIGNFIIIMLVQVLALIHLCYAWSLLIGIFVVYVIAWCRVNKRSVKEPTGIVFEGLKNFLTGTMGYRSLITNIKNDLNRTLVPRIKALTGLMRERKAECVLIALLMVAICCIYGREQLTQFGYAFSDEPVHNYWINNIGRQRLFVAGVYPMGCHCVLFFLSRMTGMDNYIVLRVFGITENFYLFMMIAAAVKALGKTKLAGYFVSIAFTLYLGFDYFCYYRYAQTLPQEFGQMFILPAVLLIGVFISERRIEIAAFKKKREKKEKHAPLRESRITGWMLAFAVCDGFASHFYNTMILAILIVGIAAGYFVYVIRPAFFVHLLKYGALGILLAIIPMAASLVTGNKLEGSIIWGMSVIRGSEDEEEEEEVYVNDDGISTSEDGTSIIVGKNYTIINDPQMYIEELIKLGKDPADSPYFNPEYFSDEDIEYDLPDDYESAEEEYSGEGSAFTGIRDKLRQAKLEMDECLRTTLFSSSFSQMVDWYYCFMIALAVMGLIFFIFRKYVYGCGLIAVSGGMLFLLVLLSASALHLPALMDTFRSRIYVAYFLPVGVGLVIDGIASLLGEITRLVPVKNLAAMVLGALLLIYLFDQGDVRGPLYANQIQLSSPVICMTNIIRDEKDKTWTVISASDERNMGFEHGYHYEMITFLHDMEYYDGTQRIQIPTESLYFFIEKKPIEYAVETELEGQPISPELALHELGPASGSRSYQGSNRWYTMSRFYEWMKVFAARYEKEVEVYYETDDFICYKLNQNTYNLYNLAVDYFYNTLDYTNEGETMISFQRHMLSELQKSLKLRGY